MQLTLKVTTNETTYEVTTNLYVIIAWERKFKQKASNLATGVGMEDLAFMAYESSKVAGITVPVVLDDFIKRLVTLEVVDNDPANPTQAEPTAIP